MPSSDEMPAHLVEICLSPRSRADQERLALELRRLTTQDSALSSWVDQESGLTILAGQSEAHLDRAIGELRGARELQIDVGEPQVAYLETLGRPVDLDHTHRKTTSPAEFARVRIVFEPAAHGSGFTFENRIVEETLPDAFVAAVGRGLEHARFAGVLAGFPLTDFRAILLDGVHHDADSTVLAFELAARGAFTKLRQKGAPLLLWPIMKIEVTTPVEFASAIIGDLTVRDTHILARAPNGPSNVIHGLVPLANLFGYGRVLEVLGRGQASVVMRYDHRAPCRRELPIQMTTRHSGRPSA